MSGKRRGGALFSDDWFAHWTAPCPVTGCWHWTAGKPGKYGVVQLGTTTKTAHAAVYEHFHGPVPKDRHGRPMVVRHKCDIKDCVNPEHLVPGTHMDNVDDAHDRGRFHLRYESSRLDKRSSFSIRLRSIRDALGLTQGQLSERVGTTQTTASRWERSGQNPDLSTVLKIAHALSVDPAWLAFGTGSAPEMIGGDHA